MSDRESSVYKGDPSSKSQSLPELKVKDAEKVAVDTLPVIPEEGNVGLSEFEAAKKAGVQVTKTETRK